MHADQYEVVVASKRMYFIRMRHKNSFPIFTLHPNQIRSDQRFWFIRFFRRPFVVCPLFIISEKLSRNGTLSHSHMHTHTHIHTTDKYTLSSNMHLLSIVLYHCKYSQTKKTLVHILHINVLLIILCHLFIRSNLHSADCLCVFLYCF